MEETTAEHLGLELMARWNAIKPDGITITAPWKEGGTSWVYDARHERSFGTQECVVKILKKLEEMPPRAREYALAHDLGRDEGRGLLAAQQSHHVLELLGEGTFDGRAYIVLESVKSRGGRAATLEEMIGAMRIMLGGPWGDLGDYPEWCDNRWINTVGQPMSRNPMLLNVLHAMNSIKRFIFNHRDLKPSNIIVTFSPPHYVYILDFQTAVLEDEADYVGMSHGSSVYSSPEERRNSARQAGTQEGGREPVKANADMYAYGLIVARCANPHIMNEMLPALEDVCERDKFEDKARRIIDLAGPLYDDVVKRCVTYDAATRSSLKDVLPVMERIGPLRGWDMGDPPKKP